MRPSLDEEATGWIDDFHHGVVYAFTSVAENRLFRVRSFITRSNPSSNGSQQTGLVIISCERNTQQIMTNWLSTQLKAYFNELVYNYTYKIDICQ